MAQVYVKVFIDYLDAIEPLGDAERGRLFTALLEYAKTGAAPQLCGNERFLFPMMRAQIDRDAAALMDLSEKRSEAGKRGGRPKAKKANAFSESKKSYDKDKEEDKEEDKDYDYDKDEDASPPFPPAPAREKRVEIDLDSVNAALERLRRGRMGD